MLQLATKIYSFEEYLTYDDGTDNKYETYINREWTAWFNFALCF